MYIYKFSHTFSDMFRHLVFINLHYYSIYCKIIANKLHVQLLKMHSSLRTISCYL